MPTQCSAHLALEILDFVSVGGSVSKPNEDSGGWSEYAAWIVDGATSLDESREWNLTSSRWLATVAHRIMGDLTQDAPIGTREVVSELSEGLASNWAQFSGNEHLIPPAGSIAMLLLHPEQAALEMAAIGDCVIVLRDNSSGKAQVITGGEFVAQEQEYLAQVPDPQAQTDEFISDLVRNRLRYIHGPPRLVLSIFPAVAETTIIKSIQDPPESIALIASDGFARALDIPEFGHSWERVLEVALGRGLTSILSAVREWERNSASFAASQYKASDDASALLLRVVREAS